MYLDALLADQPLTGGLEPRLGDAHLRMLTIVGFPTATSPGLLDELNRLAFAYRWSTRAILLDKTDATKLLTRIRRQWFAKRKSIAAILQGGDDQRGVGAARQRRRQQGRRRRRWRCRSSAPTMVGAGLCHRDDHRLGRRSGASPTRSCGWSRRSSRAATSPASRETRQRGRGLARLAAGPCLRQCPPAAGLDAQPRAHDPALGGLGGAGAGRASRRPAAASIAQTEGSTPFRFSLHVGDVGHTLVVGPTGAGKSVLLALMALQFRRYPERAGLRLRLRRLDPRGGARDGRRLARSRRRAGRRAPRRRSRCSRSRGSTMPPSAPGRRTGSRRSSRARGVAVTPEVKEHLWSALTSLASAPVERAHADRPRPCCCSRSALKRRLRPIASAVPLAGCSTPRPSGSARPTSRRSRPRG